MIWSRSFAVLSFLVATPAVAQPYPAETYYGGVVSPREVMRTVVGMGLQPVSEPHLRGHVWIVRGVGREGTMVRVVVDSHTGQVVDMHAVRRPGPFGPGYEAGPYQPDPRYVMRDQSYGPGAYPPPAPAPRPGEAYQDPPYQAPNGAMAPDDDDYDGRPVPQPRGYAPPRSSYPSKDEPRFSSKPESKRLAAKPPSVPLPKARPDAITTGTKIDAAKKDDGKKEEAKKEEPNKIDAKKEEPQKAEAKQEAPKKEEVKKDDAKKDEPKQAAAPLTSPKDPETTAAIAAAHSKAQAQPKPKPDAMPPVQPLE